MEPAVADGTVGIRVDRAQYRPADPVIVTITNRSGRTIYDDHCGGEVQGYEYLQRWNGSYGMRRLCSALELPYPRTPIIAIPHGATARDTLFVGSTAYTGTWRVMLELRDEANAALPEDQSVSNTFRVQGLWAP